ncbi:M3 family metallopeptidase [Aestuariimicrobium sp. p3-SID1156]|uniref:M3 family metallopeptidase n=1 Tax=Aestuariimicrobium sp. p3-SID1156 TaxID=2916038 RepID=UPI00223AFDAC|nr:M3 family metallopeptidase [Aestuariimicrobium sp. p3-SID1156]MCT1458995.1 M3 family metallopeptidase [Aestuariimicrobium sp. p3-SID1156]
MSNSLLSPSTLPYQLPDFANLSIEDYREAFAEGMARNREAIEQIVTNPEQATFDNTIAALERADEDLSRVQHAFYTVHGSHGTEEIRNLAKELAPKLSAHSDAIWMDPRLFARLKAVVEGDQSQLHEDARFLAEKYLTSARLAGAELDDQAREKMSALNAEMAQLRTEFTSRLLKSTNDLAVHFTEASDLDGLSPEQRDLCADAARERGLDGWLVALVNTTVHPWLSVLTNRGARRRIYEATAQRGRQGNEFDTTELVTRMVELRAERAALLGYPTHAHVRTADQTIGNPETIRERIYPLAAPALANMYREAEALQELINKRQAELGEQTFELAPWDWSYYTELLQQELFDLDSSQLRPYLEFRKVLEDGVFFAATRLYGITFSPRQDLKAYHEDVLFYDVLNEDGSVLGLLLYDPYARETKNGGAWMNSIVVQSGLHGTLPVVTQNLNLAKPREGAPTLMTVDEVNTAFHEFGHALHGLFSQVYWPTQSGTAVPRDFVEYPSQVNELWMTWPKVLANYAVHHETGEPLPKELAEKLQGLGTFNEGFMTVEYLGAALLDQELHALAPGDTVGDLDTFTARALERVGLGNPYVAPRYRPHYFAHIFGNSYDAAYYSYIWSEMLDADTCDWFRANGGLSREFGDTFRRELLGRGNSREPMASFEAVVGRGPDMTPLLKRRGLVEETA